MHHDSFHTEIMEAIGAHGAWKLRLRSAALRKETSLPVADIQVDHKCRFGKWLATFSPDMNERDSVQNVRRLHRDFHLQAGQIAGKIARGDFDAALEYLSGPAFTGVSTRLKQALIQLDAER